MKFQSANRLFSVNVMVLALLCSFISVISVEECDSSSYSAACISKLGEGFNFLKSYKIDGSTRDKVEYSYVFTRGTQYMINLCAGEASTEGITITLFDAVRNRVASSKISGQRVSSMSYSCQATGVYYIQYTFEGNAKCASSTLGFRH